jgi:3-oxoadipate enol-lactonase
MRRSLRSLGEVSVVLGAVLLVGCGESASTPSAQPAADSGAPTPKTATGKADVNGASLYYETRGSGDTVVLVHGLTLDTRMWDSQFEALSKSYHVVRFDMRGHGKSSGLRGADGGVTAFSQSEDILGVMDALTIDKAHVIGLSMGGYASYEFAVDHPDRLMSLTVIDSAWRYDPARTSSTFQTRVVGYLTTAGTDLEAGLRAWMGDALFVPAGKIAQVKADLEEIVLVGHLGLGTGAYFANPLSAMSPSPLAETRLGDLKMPMLVIVGDLDDPEFVAHADFIAGAVSGSEKVVIEGSGHMSTMEKPDEVNQALEAFLAKH